MSMTTTTSLLQQSRTSNAVRDVSGRSTHEVQQWWQIIALPLVGILLLLLCLLLQGVFAEIALGDLCRSEADYEEVRTTSIVLSQKAGSCFFTVS